jgi:hypothetical protein
LIDCSRLEWDTALLVPCALILRGPRFQVDGEDVTLPAIVIRRLGEFEFLYLG